MRLRLNDFLSYFQKVQRRPAETITFVKDGRPLLVTSVQWAGTDSWVVNLEDPGRIAPDVSRETD